MAEESNTPSPGASEQQEPQQGIKLALQRVYLKDLSFEAPLGVEGFSFPEWKPKIDQDMNTSVSQIKEELFEVVLKLTIKASIDGKAVFLIELQQAGLFHISGALEQPLLAKILNTNCLEMLFPYCREVVDNCVVKGGFPAMMIPPINFEMLFLQAVKRAQEEHAKVAQAEKESGNATTN